MNAKSAGLPDNLTRGICESDSVRLILKYEGIPKEVRKLGENFQWLSRAPAFSLRHRVGLPKVRGAPVVSLTGK